MTLSIRHVESRKHRGFTLIEVLLATFVIALGVLGLLALFAGAAKQQQVSSNETAAVFATRSAEGALGEGFGALQFPPGVQSQFALGVWYPLHVDPNWNYLTVNPSGTTDGPYFLVPNVNANTGLYAAIPRPNTVNPLPGPNDLAGFMGAPSGPFSGFTFDLVHRRVHPDSITVEVVFSRLEDDGSGAFFPQEQVLSFYRLPNQNYPSDGPNGQSFILPLMGLLTQDPLEPTGFGHPEVNYLMLDAQLTPGGLLPARITDMWIGEIGGTISPSVDTSARIERVTVRDYYWRNDQLVSLDDRLSYRREPGAPQGRQVSQSYSVLYRRTASGSQAMVVSYQLTAPSSTAVFLPPERWEDGPQPGGRNVSPIRRVSMSLHYDADDPQQQYFRVSNQNDLWAIAPGQLLLLAQGVAGGSPGSDKAVKVVRQVRETTEQGNQWRGYVDRMPRIFDQPAVARGTAGGQLFLNVYAVADTVVSLEDGSTWKLTPLIASEFQVNAN